MKVYIIMTYSDPYAGGIIDSIWSSYELAKRRLYELENDKQLPHVYAPDIDEYTLDHIPERMK